MAQAKFYYKDPAAPSPNRPNHIGVAVLLEWQGQGLTWKTNIYLMHAEDQLMAADAFETIAAEFIQVHRELHQLKGQKQ